MTERILLLASHAVAEYDDVRMFSDLGYDIFAPGGYEDPSRSGEGIRPAIPQAPQHPEFVALCNQVRAERGEPGDAIDWAKAQLHPDIIDWADAIIVHHFPERWIGGQWDAIKHKRVVWRTCGQSDPRLEREMSAFDSLQIVRYSPAERRFFEGVGCFAGEDALIRFGKYPDDYGPWDGDDLFVGNVTQNMVERGNSCGLDFYLAATEGLPARPAGPGSEQLPGGVGPLSYDEMREYLRRCRVYLYTGTRPASYTLGLIEAMMTGTPIVSIGKAAFGAGWGGEELFEVQGPTLDQLRVGADWQGLLWPTTVRSDPELAKRELRHALCPSDEGSVSRAMRRRAIELFGIDTIGAQWREFLS